MAELKVVEYYCNGCKQNRGVKMPYEEAKDFFYQGRSREKFRCSCGREDYVEMPKDDA